MKGEIAVCKSTESQYDEKCKSKEKFQNAATIQVVSECEVNKVVCTIPKNENPGKLSLGPDY